MFVRISESYERLQGFIERLAEACEKLIVYEHNESSRTHIHFYSIKCSIKPDAIKTRIKKHLDVDQYDKSNWSFKDSSDDKVITYMSKGKLEPVFNKGFLPEEVSHLKEAWIDRSKEPQIKRSSGPTQYDMSCEVYEQLVNKYKRFGTPQATIEVYTDATRLAIEVCHKYRKGFDDNSIRKIVQPAYTKFENCKGHFIDRVVNKFFY